MLTIPIPVNGQQFDLVIVLEDENLRRIQDCDPGEVHMDKFPEPYSKMRLRRIGLFYATAEQIQRLVSSNAETGLSIINKELSRGFRFRPERGDNDLPYQRPGQQ